MIPDEALQHISRIITHDNCPDGLASAMILHDVYPDAEVEFVNYKEPAHAKLEATQHMLFCDICPPAERVQEFVDAGAVVLDHHGTQQNVVSAFGERGVFADEHVEPEVSGAVLAYREVWKQHKILRKGLVDTETARVFAFATLAGIRDMWCTASPRWKEACAQASALMFYGRNRLLSREHSPWLDSYEMTTGSILFDKRLANAEQIALKGLQFSSSRPRLVERDGSRALQTIDERRVAFAFFNDSVREKLISDVTEAYRNVLYVRAEVVVGYYVSVEGHEVFYNYSLRSVDGTKGVAHFANQLGGGGHKNAAGCRLKATDKSPVRAFLTALYGEEPPPFEE